MAPNKIVKRIFASSVFVVFSGKRVPLVLSACLFVTLNAVQLVLSNVGAIFPAAS